MKQEYDAIIIGGRCAGAPLAALLARGGQRVLVLERQSKNFGALSTHTIQLRGVEKLAEWGLLPQLIARAPLIREINMSIFGISIRGLPHGAHSTLSNLCVKRPVLDKLLGEYAESAGAQFLYQHRAVAISKRKDKWIVAYAGKKYSEAVAPFLVGADGMSSYTSHALKCDFEFFRESLTFTRYCYLPNVIGTTAHIVVDEWGAQALVPTCDDDMIYVVQRPKTKYQALRDDSTGHLRQEILRIAPYATLEMDALSRVQMYTMLNQPTFVRRDESVQASLIGDAWSHKDSVTAQGISDAFADAAGLAHTLLGSFPEVGERLREQRKARRETYLPELERAYAMALFVAPSEEIMGHLKRIAADPGLASLFLGIDAQTYTWDQLMQNLKAHP